MFVLGRDYVCTCVCMFVCISMCSQVCMKHASSWMKVYRFRGLVVKGMGHLDHVRSYGVREVVSSIPDRAI